MAEKFGGYRWVKSGYLDNRTQGMVVGTMVFAAVGPVDFYLKGDFKPDIAGRIFSFTNSQFSDDPDVASRLADLSTFQVGTVSSISFDPHPLLDPHPYIEWFSSGGDHYRIELREGDAKLLEPDEALRYEEASGKIRDAYAARPVSLPAKPEPPGEEWF